MKAQPRTTRPLITPHRPGFTLVEILVVMVIITILMGVAIPAIMTGINRGNIVAMKTEVNSLVDAVKQYEQKYGDYPPDFSDWTVVQRHYKKIFPRIGAAELLRLQVLLDDTPGNDQALTANLATVVSTHNAVALDRGEVLAWCLGGYSDNPIAPFTGPGGPLEEIDTANTTTVTFQMNIDRDNKLFDFKPERLDYSDINAGVPLTATNRYVSSDGDLFASYSAKDGTPFAYFDSRTYAHFDPNIPRPAAYGGGTGDFNGFGRVAGGEIDIVRPYYSENANPNNSGSPYGTLPNALAAWDFMNPDTFQIIAPGLDGRFGSVPYFDVDGSAPLEPLYFQYRTGAGIAPDPMAALPAGLLIPGVRGYQERSVLGAAENFQLDNIADFSNAQIVDDFEP